MTRTRGWLLALSVLAAACMPGDSPSAGSPGPAGTPIGSGSAGASARATASPGTLTQAQLKVGLIDHFGPLWYCDPDTYPVARDDELVLALRNWPQVVADADALAAIRAQWGITAPDPTDADKLAIYHEWKMLRAIVLDPVGPDRWRFDYLPQPVTPSSTATRSIGTIDVHGVVVVERTEPGRAPSCPICLARGQLISTPGGHVAVEALRLGDAVWSLDARGGRVAASVIALGSTPVPAGHVVIRLVLADGRELLASAGHPLLDGRRLAELRAGDLVSGERVIAADLTPYAGRETFDLLASGPTGTYDIGGIWLRSTLRP